MLSTKSYYVINDKKYRIQAYINFYQQNSKISYRITYKTQVYVYEYFGGSYYFL